MVDMTVCEMEAENAPCRPLKLTLQKVMVKKDKFTEFQEYTEGVTFEDAKKAFADFEDFMKRNRFSEKNSYILLEKVKKEEDAEALKPYIRKFYNGWVDITKLTENDRSKVMAECSEVDRLNAWDNLSFEETDAMCAKCPLAWEKGACIGTFGPSTSGLPAIAEKYGCPIVASAIESAKTKKKFTAADAEELLRETKVLAPVLIEEGKMAAHRYSGPVERMGRLAAVCIAEKCGFYFN